MKPEDVRRRFVAVFLGGDVKSDGRVPGFGRWYDKATPYAREQLERYSYLCGLRHERGDPRSVDDLVAAGVMALREQLRYAPTETRPDDLWADPSQAGMHVDELVAATESHVSEPMEGLHVPGAYPSSR